MSELALACGSCKDVGDGVGDLAALLVFFIFIGWIVYAASKGDGP